MGKRWRSTCTASAAILLASVVSPAPGAADETVTPACAQGPVREAATIYGTPCADVIVAPPGVADVRAGGGDDVIVPAPNLSGAACPQGCQLGIGSQTFEGGPGDDVVFGERGNDRLYGGAGNDRLYGGIGDDLLRGGPGEDLLSGGFGADSIDGEEGNDHVRGDGTQDTIFDSGAGGDDTLSYSTGIAPGFFEHGLDHEEGLPGRGGRGVYLDLSAAPGAENGDDGIAPFGGGVDKVTGADFETVIGTPFSDYIVGGARGETIDGGGGADVILGAGGDDTLEGGADGDYLDGGGGTDLLDGGVGDDLCAGAESSVHCERAAGEGGVVTRDDSKVAVGALTPGGPGPTQLYLSGSEAGDEVTATYGATGVTFSLGPASEAGFDPSGSAGEGCDVPSGGSVTCPLAGPLDSLVMAGLGGDDTLEASGFPRSASIVLLGGEGGDRLRGGGESEDVLVDGPEAEGPGDDLLEALGGDDALLHNGGEDALYGGAGNDLFLSNSLCDGDALHGGRDRDNASWAKFQGPGVGARLDTGRAGQPGPAGQPECPAGTLDSLAEVEDLEGSGGADALHGDGADNQLLGWEGEDEYAAAGGEDRILANSGDYDPRIECGEGEDTALIDFPVLEPHDVAAPDCEHVQEAAKNSFRVEPEPPPPPAPAEPEAATAPIGGRGPRPPGAAAAPRPPCLGATRHVSGRAVTRCTVRPRRVRLGGWGPVRDLRWPRWRAGGAVGFGRLAVSRRRGRLTAPAELVLDRAVRCRGRRWYTRARLRYGQGRRRSHLGPIASPTPCTGGRASAVPRLRRSGHRRPVRWP